MRERNAVEMQELMKKATKLGYVGLFNTPKPDQNPFDVAEKYLQAIPNEGGHQLAARTALHMTTNWYAIAMADQQETVERMQAELDKMVEVIKSRKRVKKCSG